MSEHTFSDETEFIYSLFLEHYENERIQTINTTTTPYVN